MRTLRKRNTKLQAVSVRTYHYILVRGIHSNIITIAITTLDKKKSLLLKSFGLVCLSRENRD